MWCGRNSSFPSTSRARFLPLVMGCPTICILMWRQRCGRHSLRLTGKARRCSVSLRMQRWSSSSRSATRSTGRWCGRLTRLPTPYTTAIECGVRESAVALWERALLAIQCQFAAQRSVESRAGLAPTMNESYKNNSEVCMLDLKGLTKRYATGDLALDNVDLTVPAGQVLALIGPSGAGKSTLIRCVNRLVEPTSGTIKLDGDDITK